MQPCYKICTWADPLKEKKDAFKFWHFSRKSRSFSPLFLMATFTAFLESCVPGTIHVVRSTIFCHLQKHSELMNQNLTRCIRIHSKYHSQMSHFSTLLSNKIECVSYRFHPTVDRQMILKYLLGNLVRSRAISRLSVSLLEIMINFLKTGCINEQCRYDS